MQPIASTDVADAVARLALRAPANGIVDIAGPVREPLADLVGRFMKAVQDPRTVVSDPGARYFGAELQLDTLVPAGPAWQGASDFDAWFAQSRYAQAAPRA